MWLLVARPPQPDAPGWPGRRGLAAIDALLWPLLWVVVVSHVPVVVGLVGPFVVRSRRNPATRSRHIPATWRGAQGHLEAPC